MRKLKIVFKEQAIIYVRKSVIFTNVLRAGFLYYSLTNSFFLYNIWGWYLFGRRKLREKLRNVGQITYNLVYYNNLIDRFFKQQITRFDRIWYSVSSNLTTDKLQLELQAAFTSHNRHLSTPRKRCCIAKKGTFIALQLMNERLDDKRWWPSKITQTKISTLWVDVVGIFHME